MTGTMLPGNWANTTSFNLPVGTFILIINPIFVPGTTSTATFSNIQFVVNTQFNNAGTGYYTFNDARVRQTMNFGTGGTYDNIYNIGILTLTAAQGTLYASAHMNYTTGGSNINGSITGGAAYFYRIG